MLMLILLSKLPIFKGISKTEMGAILYNVPILAFFILKEGIPINTILGIIFILFGSFIMLKYKNHNKVKDNSCVH